MASVGDQAISVYAFTKSIPSELGVRVGDRLRVVSLSSDGQWAWCRNTEDEEGFVPNNYLQPVPRPVHEQQQPWVTFASSNKDNSGTSEFSEDYNLSICCSDMTPNVYEDDSTPKTFYKVTSSTNASSSQHLTVRAGEMVMASKETGSSNLLRVESCRLVGREGFVPRAALRMASQLEAKPWFLGTISRDDAENLLKPRNIQSGTFLIRESETTAGYVITHKDTDPESGKSVMRHRKITVSASNQFTAWSGYSFTTLTELVATHSSPAGLNLLTTPYNKVPDHQISRTPSHHLSSVCNPPNRERIPPQPPTAPKPTQSSGLKPVLRTEAQQAMPLNPPPLLSRGQFPAQAPHPERPTPPPVPYRNIGRGPLVNTNNTDDSDQFYGLSSGTTKRNMAPPDLMSSVGSVDHKSVRPMSSQQRGPSAAMASPPIYPAVDSTPASILSKPLLDSLGTYSPLVTADIHRNPTMAKQEEWYINPQKVKRLEQLGEGHYGEVWKARFIRQDTFIALKTFNRATMDLSDFLKEVDAMKDLRHPNLIKLYGVCADPSNSFMIMEYHPNGSVMDYLSKDGVLTSVQKLRVAQEVAAGMEYLADLHYIHRDLAARNVLLASDLTPRVADFGLAQLDKSHHSVQQSSGCSMKMPWKWTAPEALLGGIEWTTKCDVWSYGVFCWELYTNCSSSPYTHISKSRDLVEYLSAGGRLNQPIGCEDVIYNKILRRCWTIEATQRIHFQEIVHFFKFEYKRK